MREKSAFVHDVWILYGGPSLVKRELLSNNCSCYLYAGPKGMDFSWHSVHPSRALRSLHVLQSWNMIGQIYPQSPYSKFSNGYFIPLPFACSVMAYIKLVTVRVPWAEALCIASRMMKVCYLKYCSYILVHKYNQTCQVTILGMIFTYKNIFLLFITG